MKKGFVKICDLGTAIDRSDAATAQIGATPYLVSRFYRAPEVILGIPYDYAIDMWSIGCTLFEMYTGKVLFSGRDNNQMLKSIQQIRGKLTQKLFKRGSLAGQHFNEKGEFINREYNSFDKVCIFFFSPPSLPLPLFPHLIWNRFPKKSAESHAHHFPFRRGSR